jgi:hypothetical protein
MKQRPVQGRATGLTGRRGEGAVLDGLVDAVRAGESRVLVVCGEPGVGKTALPPPAYSRPQLRATVACPTPAGQQTATIKINNLMCRAMRFYQ